MKEIHKEVRLLAEKCAHNVAYLQSDPEDQSRLEEECLKVQEVYKNCFSNLEMCFSQLLDKIYRIESETFKNYKFKDTVAIFDTLL